jgi:hypothetical protein
MKEKLNIQMGVLIALVVVIGSYTKKVDLTLFLVIVLLLCIVCPIVFTPLRLLWFKFSKILEKIVTPLILFTVYVIVLIPVGLLRRAFGKDTMHLKDFRKLKNTVFTDRNKTFNSDDFNNQY